MPSPCRGSGLTGGPQVSDTGPKGTCSCPSRQALTWFLNISLSPSTPKMSLTSHVSPPGLDFFLSTKSDLKYPTTFQNPT